MRFFDDLNDLIREIKVFLKKQGDTYYYYKLDDFKFKDIRTDLIHYKRAYDLINEIINKYPVLLYMRLKLNKIHQTYQEVGEKLDLYTLLERLTNYKQYLEREYTVKLKQMIEMIDHNAADYDTIDSLSRIIRHVRGKSTRTIGNHGTDKLMWKKELDSHLKFDIIGRISKLMYNIEQKMKVKKNLNWDVFGIFGEQTQDKTNYEKITDKIQKLVLFFQEEFKYIPQTDVMGLAGSNYDSDADVESNYNYNRNDYFQTDVMGLAPKHLSRQDSDVLSDYNRYDVRSDYGSPDDDLSDEEREELFDRFSPSTMEFHTNLIDPIPRGIN